MNPLSIIRLVIEFKSDRNE